MELFCLGIVLVIIIPALGYFLYEIFNAPVEPQPGYYSASDDEGWMDYDSGEGV